MSQKLHFLRDVCWTSRKSTAIILHYLSPLGAERLKKKRWFIGQHQVHFRPPGGKRNRLWESPWLSSHCQCCCYHCSYGRRQALHLTHRSLDGWAAWTLIIALVDNISHQTAKQKFCFCSIRANTPQRTQQVYFYRSFRTLRVYHSCLGTYGFLHSLVSLLTLCSCLPHAPPFSSSTWSTSPSNSIQHRLLLAQGSHLGTVLAMNTPSLGYKTPLPRPPPWSGRPWDF